MNLLLDTHIALRAITDNAKLSKQAREIIQAPDTAVWISAASIWEIAIKHGLGRGDMPVSSRDALRYFQQSGYRLLAITPEHAAATETLAAHHHDTFDRMLVAQALVELMRLITHAPQVALYGDTIIKV